MVAPTTLLYTIPYSKKNFNKVRDLSIGYVATWLDMLDEQDGPLMKDVDSKETQAELLRLDVRTRQFCGRDPDTKNVANLFGLETTDKLVRTLWGDPDDKIWSSRWFMVLNECQQCSRPEVALETNERYTINHQKRQHYFYM